jgi:hypothetical protein
MALILALLDRLAACTKSRLGDHKQTTSTYDLVAGLTNSKGASGHLGQGPLDRGQLASLLLLERGIPILLLKSLCHINHLTDRWLIAGGEALALLLELSFVFGKKSQELCASS